MVAKVINHLRSGYAALQCVRLWLTEFGRVGFRGYAAVSR